MIPSYLINRKFGKPVFRSSSEKFADVSKGVSNSCLVDTHFSWLKPTLQNEFLVANSGPLTSIHLERCEYRYILTSCESGTISLYDLDRCHTTDKESEKARKPLVVLCNEVSIRNSRSNLDNFDRSIRKLFRAVPNNHTRCISRVQWWPVDNGIFTTSGFDGVLNIWDTNELSIVSEYSSVNVGLIHGHETNPSGSGVIAIATERSGIVLFDIRSGSSFNKIVNRDKKRERNYAVMDVHWAPSNDWHLLSCSPDEGLKLYDVRKGLPVVNFIPSLKSKQEFLDVKMYSPLSSSFSSDGSYIMCLCANGGLLQFNVTDGTLKRLTEVPGKTVPSALVYQFATSKAFKTDSIFIANGSNTVSRFNTQTGGVCSLGKAHFRGVHCCELNDSTLQLYTAGKDREIVTWMANRKDKLVKDDASDLSDWDI